MKTRIAVVLRRTDTCRIRLVVALIGLLLLSTVVAGAVNVDVEAILRSMDRWMNFEDTDVSAVMSMVIEDPENDEVTKRAVQQFRRDADDKFLMLVLEPEDRKGQGYLRVDDNMWMYDPVSRKFSHTSLKEHFENSDARNSDFRRSSTAEDYAVADYTEGKLGRYEVYILELKAKHEEVTYPFMKVWVTKSSNLVLKREEYSLTERLMRTSLFPKYARIGEQFVATQTIFIDELVEGKKTQITISDISVESLPDYVFTKAYVERVNQ